MADRRFVPLLAPASALLVAMTLLLVPPAVRATDPPPGDPPPPPEPGALTIIREPAFNPASPLLGLVQILDAGGAVVQSWTSPQPNDMFGLSAVLVPDANGDGIDDIAIAAPNAFDEVVGARIGTVSIKSGTDGSTIASIAGLPHQRFGLALYAAAGDEPGSSPTITVLVEHLDPNTGLPYQPSAFTFQTFDAFSGWLVAESVPAPAGFTAQAARDSIADYLRATGPADLDADGSVSASDLAILAGNFGSQVDPVTGALLQQDPTLAAAPTGDTNGDGIVDADDLLTVISNISSQNPDGSPNFVPVDDPLTEAEATAIEGAFAAAMGRHIESSCSQCTYRPCWCVLTPDDIDPFSEIDGNDGQDEVDTDGDRNPDPPEGGTPPGGGGGPNPNGDDDGDGIPNKHDCDSEAFTGGGGNCDDPCGDDNGDGVKNQDDCESECYQGDPEECECRVMIGGCPTPDGLPDNGVSPTEVLILPSESGSALTLTLTASGEPGGGVYHWSIVGAAATALDQPSITLTITNPGPIEAVVVYTVDLPDGQQCTSRDRCAFLVWRCGIEEAPETICLTEPPTPTTLAIDPFDAIDAEIVWTVIDGADHVETEQIADSIFQLTPTEPGQVTVRCELRRNGVSRCHSDVTLTIPGPLCGTNVAVVPTHSTVLEPPSFAGTDFGLTVYDKATITTAVCIDPSSDGWTNRVLSVESTCRYAVNLLGRVDVSSASDAVVTAQTYRDIVDDLTPSVPIDGFLGAPYSAYAVSNCIDIHERQHVTEWEQTLDLEWTRYESQFETGVASCGLFSHPEDAEHYFALLTFDLADRLFDDTWLNVPKHPGTSQAYPIENACLSVITAAILQRAAAENWP